jgi:DNA-binding transcriptional regulator YiaG
MNVTTRILDSAFRKTNREKVQFMRYENVPRLLKSIRKTLSLTQEQLAHRLGVSFVTVNEWENGKRKPSPLARRQIEPLVKEVGIKLPEPKRSA